MERVNLFNPFDSKSFNHEDRLTWAFLVVLKYDPFLQNFLRELVLTKGQLPLEYRSHGNVWELARVSTQARRIESSPRFLISILLTDEPLQDPADVEWSDRMAVYDGVIEYPNGLTLIIENKPSYGNVWKEQLSPSRKSLSSDVEVEDVELYKSAICLEWSDILEDMLRYIHSGIPPFGNCEITRDFLSFVEKSHPELTPYRTFELCGHRSEALKRRTILLADALARNGENLERKGFSDGWPYIFRPDKIAQRVAFSSVSESNFSKLRISLWPADTIEQARCFYNAVDRGAFLSLEKFCGWRVKPNLHFSYIRKHLVWAETSRTVSDYLDLFSDRPELYRQWKADRDTLAPLVESWERDGLISSKDARKIETEFIETNNIHINVIPGFEVYREWDIEEVVELEKRGELNAHILESLGHVLRTWKEEL